MQIECDDNSDKKNILETLLWLGCKNAQGKGKDEEEILDATFKPFKSLKVTRRREGESYLSIDWSKEGLGYWRGISAAGINPITDPSDIRSEMFYDATVSPPVFIPRDNRTVIFQHGEFRCGEWADFFVYIALSQGISLTKLINEPEHHFKFDLHVKKDIYGVPIDFVTIEIDMEDHLIYPKIP